MGTSSDTVRLSGSARSVISCGRAVSCGVADQCTRTTLNAEYAEKRNSNSPGMCVAVTRFTWLQRMSGSSSILHITHALTRSLNATCSRRGCVHAIGAFELQKTNTMRRTLSMNPLALSFLYDVAMNPPVR